MKNPFEKITKPITNLIKKEVNHAKDGLTPPTPSKVRWFFKKMKNLLPDVSAKDYNPIQKVDKKDSDLN